MNGSTHGNLGPADLIEAGDIPEWLLFEVLMRLPFKVLFKLKTVSKRWCCMISDACFARTYVDRISRLPHLQQWILVSSFASKAVTNHFFQNKLPLDGCSSLGANCLDLLFLPRDQTDGLDYLVVGISSGFFLYGPRVEAARRHVICSYEICNPITGQRITLPPSRHCFEFVATGFLTQVEDNVLQSYRVVRVDVHHMDSGFIRFDVYSSETRKWVNYRIYSRIYFYKWKNPVVLGKTLHWMATGHSLVTYDPYNKPDSVRLIGLPSHDAASYGQSKTELELRDVMFDEYQGQLRYVEVKLPDLSIWVLNDYDSGRWSVQHRVHIHDLGILPVPLCFHPFDSNIVYIINKKAVFSYDFETRELKIVDESRKSCVHRLPYCLSYFSFVIPPWPLSIHPEILSNNPKQYFTFHHLAKGLVTTLLIIFFSLCLVINLNSLYFLLLD